MPLQRLVDLTEVQTTSLRVFELLSKTRNVLPVFRIRRKSFAVTSGNIVSWQIGGENRSG